VLDALQPAGEAPAAARGGPAVDAERPWEVRTIVDHADPVRANADALQDLENGAASLLLTLDPSGAEAWRPARRRSWGGRWRGVLLDLAPVALDAGWLGPVAGDWLAELAKGGPAAPLALHMDPLGDLGA
jgi:methylmalonyl-CoA mutase